MDAGTLTAAAAGAVIGVGSTLITDSVRARRDLDQKWIETKRLVYVRFLVALTQAHSRIKVAAFENLPAPEKRELLAVHSTTIHNMLKPKQSLESWPSHPLNMCIGSHSKFMNASALYVMYFSSLP